MRTCYSLIVMLATTLLLQAQESQPLSGVVLDSKTGFPVPYASILIKNKQQGMGATGKGTFRLNLSLGDTLQISSIGYETLTIGLDSSNTNFSEVSIFKLNPAVYDLDSLEIFELSDHFYLKRPKRDTLDIGVSLPAVPRDWSRPQTLPLTTGEAGVIITGFLNSFDKTLKQKQILNEFSKADAFRKQRAAEREKYFNKELVKRVTRIDDRVIDEFMEFCNFLDGQIIGKTEYEITLLILERYKAFLRR
ncbi:carboxypeptidase-like regulatory domain-containing protein [Roseivirga sp. UBA838]|uniref:carboxypeptidase-like regulatory domain-containing protein n=1 Tax=Roseivirga sp. UBA838 TaxID=1947393 RepID=UPI00257DDE72|nr:carboxypeptidase-like regulatory domain-containing protein [Roseivirga sp. UBA838]